MRIQQWNVSTISDMYFCQVAYILNEKCQQKWDTATERSVKSAAYLLPLRPHQDIHFNSILRVVEVDVGMHPP